MTLLSLLQAASPPPGGDALAWNEVLTEYIKFAGYFLSIGAVGYRYLILPRFDRDSGGEAMIGRNAAATLGVVGVFLLILAALGGVEIGALMHHKSFIASMPKATGQFQFKMVALALALVGYTLATRASAKTGWPMAAIGILAAVLQPVVTSRGFSGRVNAVHVLAASTWLGTLTVMVLTGIRALVRAPAGGLSRERTAAGIVNAFTPTALTAATIVAISGVTIAWLHVKHLSNLWKTEYGIALVVKLCFVGAVVFMGWWNWKMVKPSLTDGEQSVARLNLSATAEVILGAIVLVITAVLVSLPSPR